MFRTVSLSIIRSSSLHTQQWYMSYRIAYSLLAIWQISASSWFYYKNLSRCKVTWSSNISKRGFSYLNYVQIDFCSYLLQYFNAVYCIKRLNVLWSSIYQRDCILLQNVTSDSTQPIYGSGSTYFHGFCLTWLSAGGAANWLIAKSLHPPTQLTNSVQQKLTVPQLFNRELI